MKAHEGNRKIPFPTNSYLIRHNFPRPLTYILIANNLNQNKILRLHNHARSFMTCIFLTNGTIHFNPLNLFQFDAPPQHHIPYPQLEIPDNDPSSTVCFPSLAVMVFIKFTSNILNPNLILSRPINPSLSNSIKKPQTTINYHFCCLNCSSDIATMAGGISYPTVPRLHDASPPSILPILALTSSAPCTPNTNPSIFDCHFTPSTIDPKPSTPISLFNPI
ncbi:hypothetical protein PAPYR_8640 [Paratrimastix pyriformis]|uniref:Uncharacterized protein n=1 Tax=Paratrimastix pyriformis TaxID=342808 RepID=A0ABQ8UFM8_9EUKA|nr:hypothetical protein PAPYR_8640 [Paratrimastix pyriformis]